MQNQPRGWVLLAVLIFIGVLSLGSLSAWQRLGWQQRFLATAKQRNNVLMIAQVALRRIENSLSEFVPGCQIAVTPAPILVRKTRDWWRSVSCAGNLQTLQYYYVVEWLGSDPSASISSDPGNSAGGVEYYRVTLAALSATNTDSPWLLQSTFTRRSQSSTPCTARCHLVSLGRQRWQELY